MSLPTRVETVIIGAGQAGLTMSSYLSRAGAEHLILEKSARPGGSWRSRWDSFRLVTPNWIASFPDYPYDGPEPDGFMSRDEIDARITGYADRISAPVESETEILRLTTRGAGAGASGFRLETTRGDLLVEHVVVATGSFHRRRIPPISASLPARIAQLHTQDYRNEPSLPAGAVLIVGSGQSGCQIAEELLEAGRAVYLSVGSAGRVPRRYRGRDFFHWLALLATRGEEFGVQLPTVDRLPDPRMRSAGNPHLSGHRGGHDINLRQMALEGATLLGRIVRVEEESLVLAPGLLTSIARADAFFDERFRPLIDRLIEAAGVEAPPDDRRPVKFEPPEISTIDLAGAGISTIIWATGYALDFGWIELPIFDEYGFPRHSRGVAEVPGLGFIGLLWQHTQASATLFGPNLDAPHLIKHMGYPHDRSIR